MKGLPLRTILVTGASSGLGAGVARSYAAPDVRLLLVGRDADRLGRTARACEDAGAAVEIGRFDVGSAEPYGDWLLAQDRAHPIDLVAAFAGVSGGPAAAGRGEGVAIAAMQVRANLLGAIHTIEPLLPAMIARRHGQIALVASVAGLRGLPYSPAYSATKAGVRAYGEGLRALLAPCAVAVTVIVPGFFDTPMTDRFKGAKPQLVSLERMVAVVRRGLDRRAARVTFPRLLALGIVATDLLPAAIGDRILRGVHFHIEPGR